MHDFPYRMEKWLFCKSDTNGSGGVSGSREECSVGTNRSVAVQAIQHPLGSFPPSSAVSIDSVAPIESIWTTGIELVGSGRANRVGFQRELANVGGTHGKSAGALRFSQW
mgnify:CR=1 FL=1